VYLPVGNDVAIVSAGRLRWRVRTDGLIEVSPAEASDGTVVFGSNDSLEYGVTQRGRVRWRSSINEYLFLGPGLPGDRVVFGDRLGHVSLLDARNGRVIRRYRDSRSRTTRHAHSPSRIQHFVSEIR
jgi:outer membrane protein assembly factor BamB